jgi:hypothetical protein
MANWFVRSSATGTGAGTSWTNATTTIAAAITLSAAGDTFFVADDHAETQASALTLSFKGTPAVPDKVLCVDHTITSPGTGDLKTTATATTTGAFNVNVNGSFFCYGITFNCRNRVGWPAADFKRPFEQRSDFSIMRIQFGCDRRRRPDPYRQRRI